MNTKTQTPSPTEALLVTMLLIEQLGRQGRFPVSMRRALLLQLLGIAIETIDYKDAT